MRLGLMMAVAGLTCFATTLPLQAAEAARAIIDGMGLDGRWAPNCNRQASADNPYFVYETFRAGHPVQRRMAPPEDEQVVELLDVRKLKRNLLSWVIAEGEVMLTVTSRLEGNQMRVWSIEGSDGVAHVVDAKFADGRATPWLSKCETN